MFYLSLSSQILHLQKQLEDQFVVRSALEKALTNRPLSYDPKNGNSITKVCFIFFFTSYYYHPIFMQCICDCCMICIPVFGWICILSMIFLSNNNLLIKSASFVVELDGKSSLFCNELYFPEKNRDIHR